MKTNFHMKGWAPGLTLKKRSKIIRKWPILFSTYFLLMTHITRLLNRVLVFLSRRVKKDNKLITLSINNNYTKCYKFIVLFNSPWNYLNYLKIVSRSFLPVMHQILLKKSVKMVNIDLNSIFLVGGEFHTCLNCGMSSLAKDIIQNFI